MSKIQALQTVLGVKPDGVFGPVSQAALDALIHADWHRVKASSFADPADIAAFRRAKAKGASDLEAFKVGDNGIGFFRSHDCTSDVPVCALPREDWLERWGTPGQAALKPVLVRANGREVLCILGDTMPARRYLRAASLDLNPAACAALGLKPPTLTEASWRWA